MLFFSSGLKIVFEVLRSYSTILFVIYYYRFNLDVAIIILDYFLNILEIFLLFNRLIIKSLSKVRNSTSSIDSSSLLSRIALYSLRAFITI